MRTVGVFIQSQRKRLPVKAIPKSSAGKRFRRQVAAWAALWQENKKGKQDLSQKAKKVMALMKRFRTMNVSTRFGEVIWVVSMKKEASLKDIEGHFGKDKAEAFWKTLKTKRSEYLSVFGVEK